MSDIVERIEEVASRITSMTGVSAEAWSALRDSADEIERLRGDLVEANVCAADATLQQRASRLREEHLRELLREACDLHSGVRPDSADDWKRRATDFLDSYKEQP